MDRNSSHKVAVLVGATGLVGSELLTQLLANPSIAKVVSLGRRFSGKQDPKLEEHIVDFEDPATWRDWVRGDMLFSALGTTRAKAGSKEAQYRVDYTYQFEMAKAAADHIVPVYVLCSSVGANPKAGAFYMRMKGELDRDVQQLGFQSLHVVRPGPLYGVREKPRALEKVAVAVVRLFNALGLFRKYRPISGGQVAQAMILLAMRAERGNHVHEPKDLFLMVGGK